MSQELYKRYRPKTLKGVLGQSGAISVLESFISKNALPHALLFNGPSGTGKTTLARILRDTLGCAEQEFYELNTADFRGIDMVRNIRSAVSGRPLLGKTRIWLIDECHQMSKDGQQAMLKILEDTPSHVYFFLATTDPQKLLPTIITRCTEIRLQPLDDKALRFVLERVINKEQIVLGDGVLDEIVEVAEGSARKGLVILEQVAQVSGEEAQREAIITTTFNKDLAISLARVLIAPRAQWVEAAALLKQIKDDPEGVRYVVLGYARTCLLSGGKFAAQAFKIIDIFSKNFYDSKHAGLAAACYEVIVLAK